MSLKRAGIAAMLAAVVTAGCSTAAAENAGDNTEAEAVVVYAGQLGPDWKQTKLDHRLHPDKEALTLAASPEAQRCFHRPASEGVTAVASGDAMTNLDAGGFLYNQVAYHRAAVDVDALAADFADPKKLDCWRSIAAPAWADSAGQEATDLTITPIPVAAPAGTRAVGVRFTATMHGPDGTAVPIRQDLTSLFVGRAEAVTWASGPATAFPDGQQQFLQGMIADRLLKADTA